MLLISFGTLSVDTRKISLFSSHPALLIAIPWNLPLITVTFKQGSFTLSFMHQSVLILYDYILYPKKFFFCSPLHLVLSLLLDVFLLLSGSATINTLLCFSHHTYNRPYLSIFIPLLFSFPLT